MVLYTCGQKKQGPAAVHPCAKAARALDGAGYRYEIKVVGGLPANALDMGQPQR